MGIQKENWAIPVTLNIAGEIKKRSIRFAVTAQLVLQGRDWTPGIVVHDSGDFEDSGLIAEVIESTFNEGELESGSITLNEGSRDEEKAIVTWEVPSFAKKILDFGIDNLPVGSKIVTEDGYTFSKCNDGWTDGDMELSGIKDLESVNFEVYPDESWAGFDECAAPNAGAPQHQVSLSHKGFVWNGVEIINPTLSSCGRFIVDPKETYGFSIYGTGGGCTALHLEAPGEGYCMITSEEGSSHEYNHEEGATFLFGIYDDDGNEKACYRLKVGIYEENLESITRD